MVRHIKHPASTAKIVVIVIAICMVVLIEMIIYYLLQQRHGNKNPEESGEISGNGDGEENSPNPPHDPVGSNTSTDQDTPTDQEVKTGSTSYSNTKIYDPLPYDPENVEPPAGNDNIKDSTNKSNVNPEQKVSSPGAWIHPYS